ncbi:LLM class flavin-dependent oxidoreductase [Nonomuraea sp. NPDC050783]|uniref:LLM class flavin-dependent oxidoreductase n=1 Tax=Nonomuraea sp. NPDC050783 TaxID=3154634 RepID=UPI003465B78C
MKVAYTCLNHYADKEVLDLNFTPTARRLWDRQRAQQSLSETLSLVKLADDLGFDYISFSEHHYTGGMMNPNPAVSAAAVSQLVKNAGVALLGPLASINNPVRIAEELAMLDHLTDGRIICAPLRGTPNEFVNYNVDADETRGRTQEAMLLIRKALTSLEPFSWDGTYFQFPVVSVWPGPTQTPHPPLYSSVNSPESVDFAARHRFAAAASYYEPQMIANIMDSYRDQCEKHGWTPSPEQQLYRSYVVVGESPAHAVELKERFAGDNPPPHAFAPGLTSDAEMTKKDMAGFGFGFLQFVGDTSEVTEQIIEFQRMTGVGMLDLGFTYGYFTHDETADMVTRFAKDVLPKLRGL